MTVISTASTPGHLSVLRPDLLSSTVATAEELRALIASRYDVDTVGIEVGRETFEMLRVHDTNRLLDLVTPELFSLDERLPYWADLWTSSIGLADWLLQEEKIAGKSVLELGSGLGLAGIAAARAGAQVTMTDYETDALLFARYNALRNLPADTPGHRVDCMPMDWRVPNIAGKFDVIIGADIVYERRNFSPVLSLLQAHLAPGGRALLTEPDRTVGTEFLDAARERGFLVQRSYSTVRRNEREQRISRAILESSQ